MKSRDDLIGGEAKIEQFLTHLAVDGKVAPSTQNQAMNALVFLYKKVFQYPFDQKIDAVRAKEKNNRSAAMRLFLRGNYSEKKRSGDFQVSVM